jgi:5-methylcytosine-specific restriction endonuclease McrA
VRRVLLLNASYEPLAAVSWRRAVGLVLADKAETLEVDPEGRVVRSMQQELLLPAVIRLTYYVHVPYLGRVPLTRRAVMQRDNYSCAYCGNRAETIDHVVPRSRGGQHTWENVVAACKLHNLRKANHLLSELGWTLRVVPRAPQGPRWTIGLDHLDPIWLPYLSQWAA